MMFRTTNTTKTTAAQKIGRFSSGMSRSDGTSVQPRTSPTSSLAGLGFVSKLTTTVTITQATHDQRPRYMFSAIARACSDSAM